MLMRKTRRNASNGIHWHINKLHLFYRNTSTRAHLTTVRNMTRYYDNLNPQNHTEVVTQL
jgi:hypothetical protein